jgi:hypothetical protein
MLSMGCKEASPSRKSWLPGINAVRSAIDAELKDGKDVLAILHSARALLANEAFEGVDAAKVKQMIVAGFLVDSGNSVLSFCGGFNPAVWDYRKGPGPTTEVDSLPLVFLYLQAA